MNVLMSLVPFEINCKMDETQEIRFRVLEAVKRGAVKVPEILGPGDSNKVRARRKVLQDMEAEGLILRLSMFHNWWVMLPGWKPTDDFIYPRLIEKCKRVDECLIWVGRVRDDGAPVYVPPLATKPVSARREIYRMKAGRAVRRERVVRMRCENPACLNFDHMYVSVSGGWNKGEKMPEDERLRRERRARALSPLDMDKAREIRRLAAVEMLGTETLDQQSFRVINRATDLWLAKMFGVKEQSIRDIRNGRTWREHQGVFSGLFR